MAPTRWWRRPAVVLAAGVALCPMLARGEPALSDAVAEPYHYCQPQAGGKAVTPPPSMVDHNIRVINGQSPPITDSTGETPPQAELLASLGAFALPADAVTVRVVIACAAPPAVLPPDGTLDGNVYSFTVSAGGTPLSLRSGQQATVMLRGPAGIPHPVVERYAAGQWLKLGTRPVGAIAPDTYSAPVTDLGDFALVVSSTTVPAAPGDDHTVVVLALVAVAVALFAAGTLVVVRGRAR